MAERRERVRERETETKYCRMNNVTNQNFTDISLTSTRIMHPKFLHNTKYPTKRLTYNTLKGQKLIISG